MATAKEIVPFAPPADDRSGEAISGEVITPEGELKANEKVIRKGWKTATAKVAEVYNALTIIHTKHLWKLHLDAHGKRKYSNFETYLFTEFGWNLDRTRALQIIKERRQALLEAGELSPEDMPKERSRTAPVQTPTKAAEVTIKQLTTVKEAFNQRLVNIEDGPGLDALDEIYENLAVALAPIITALEQVIEDEKKPVEDESDSEDENDGEDESDE